MSFGDRLKEARLMKGLKQSELSKKIGLSKGAVSNYEVGVSFPNIEILYKLFEVLDVSPNYLFQDEIPTHEVVLTTGEKAMINNYRSLNDIGQNRIQEDIRLLLLDDKYKKENKPPVKEQKKMPTIFYYDVPASAGTGEYLDYSTASLVSVDDDIPSNASYILKVAGDSMEPRFSDGDYIYVNKNNSLNFGDIGIFYYDNNVYIKKYGPEGLISLNPKYSDIKGHEDIRCLGKVIGKVNGEIYF